jgi:predicted ATPase
MAKVYVISGGPATGKTTIIKELKKRGYKVLEEAARQVIRDDERFKGKSVNEISKREFQEAIFEFQKKQLENLNFKEIIFSDRGLGDTIAYLKIYGLNVRGEIADFAKEFRYSGIFILEPLNFYVTDDLRKETKEEAEAIHREIIKTYRELGYNLIIVPFMSVKKRVSFIKANIS